MNKYIIRYTDNNEPFIDSEDYNKKLVCEICGQRVVNNNGLASHIRRTHKMKPKEYYDKYLKKDGEGICPVCGKETRFWKLGCGYSSHCSKICSNNDTSVRDKITQTRRNNHAKGIKIDYSKKTNRTIGHGSADTIQQPEKNTQNGYEYYKTSYNYNDESIKHKRAKTNKEVIKIINDLGYFTRKQLINKYQRGWLSLDLEPCIINGHPCFRKELIKEIEEYCEHGYGTSLFEKGVLKFVKSVYKGKIKTHDRQTIKPLELDIVLPSENLAIECDGAYYHAYPKRDKYYHQIKTDKCQEKGITLVHINEDDWKNKKEVCKIFITNLLNSKPLEEYDIAEIDLSTFANFIKTKTLDIMQDVGKEDKLYMVSNMCCVCISKESLTIYSTMEFSVNIDILTNALKSNKRIFVNRANNFDFSGFEKVGTTKPVKFPCDRYIMFNDGLDCYERKIK